MATVAPQFPLVDALLLTPDEGRTGMIGVCTNTSAPGQVYNEIEQKFRSHISVLGPAIVSRDGVERMILNSLAHPTMRLLILFSEEALTFSPSTNLLLALEKGLDTSKSGNFIADGKAASAHYPNLSKEIVDKFREQITVLPLFMFHNDYSRPILENYLEWLKPRVDEKVYTFLKGANSKEKIYYDALNKLLALLESLPQVPKELIALDPKDFQHLQPPKVEVDAKDLSIIAPYRVSREGDLIRVDLKLPDGMYFIRGQNEFLIEYSLMRFLGERKSLLSPLEQLLLGAEISRVNTEIKNETNFPSFVADTKMRGDQEILLAPRLQLETDKKYYYRISVKGEIISVMCLAFDVCEEVFELRSTKAGGIYEWLAEKNRFEDYEMDVLHRIDVGGQIARAHIAATLGYSFIQDFATIFKVNTTNLPLCVVQSDTFLDTHRKLLMELYTKGLTEEHGDKRKGTARSAAMLAIYRDAKTALATLPTIYKQGEQTTDEMREAYKKQLLRFDSDGDYSYGQRTRAHFGFDQLESVTEVLKKDPYHAAIIARYDPKVDMGSHMNPDTGKLEYTEDPCLTHDIFFMSEGKLHSFHLARAHNTVNAYPENIFGLHDAYVTTVRDGIGAESGDMYMLSSRANILLLVEEQRTRKLLAEPSKPAGDLNTESGPHLLGENVSTVEGGGVAYLHIPLTLEDQRPDNEILGCLEDYEGVDTITKAISYLKNKGGMHNNPVLSEYYPGKFIPQGDYLAFFQANVMGGKVHATAVFMNHSLKKLEQDKKLCNHIATRFSKELNAPLGNLSLFYVGYPLN